MDGVNNCFFIGNLVRDVEKKTLQTGSTVANFTLAINRTFKDPATNSNKEEVVYADFEYWNPKPFIDSFTKGKLVFVDARLKTRTYEDKDGKRRTAFSFHANHLRLLSPSGSKEAPTASAPDEDTPF